MWCTIWKVKNRLTSKRFFNTVKDVNLVNVRGIFVVLLTLLALKENYEKSPSRKYFPYKQWEAFCYIRFEML
jgi:hypothetical protein